MVALALLRLCGKFELTGKCRDIVLKHLGTGTEKGAVYHMELRLLRRLRTRSEPISFDDVEKLQAWDPYF